MTKTVNVHDAKTHLSKLLEDVEAGDEIIIARRGKPVARMVRYERKERRPRWARRSLLGPIDDSALDPMTDDELRDWGLL